ncbi:MAG: hypothetical protein ACRDLO_02990 [Solirubrobacterales bacterium]
MASPRRALVPLLLFAALALVACGSNEEDNDYVEQVNEIQNRLVDEVTETVSGEPPANPNAAAGVAADLEGVFESTADEFEAIEPPEDVADLHDQLVAAIRGVGTRIGEAEKAFASGSSQRAARAALELQTATTDLQPRLNTLIDDINAQLQD